MYISQVRCVASTAIRLKAAILVMEVVSCEWRQIRYEPPQLESINIITAAATKNDENGDLLLLRTFVLVGTRVPARNI